MPTINIPNVGTVDLPDYAMQHTLESLYHVMAGMSAEQAKDFGTLANTLATNTSVERQTKASVDDLQPPLENIASSSRQNVQQTSLTLKQMQKGIKDANKNAASQTSAFRQTAQVMRGAGNMLSGGGMGELASLMPGKWTQTINTASKVLQKFADTQRNLTDVGMGLGASIVSTTMAVTSLNMPIFEFERVAGKYSLAIDTLNDSTFELNDEFTKFTKAGVNKGAIMFSSLSNEVRKSMEPFGNMGLTVTEINTYLGEYLESDRKRGVSTMQSFEGLTGTFSHLIKEASAYAIDTGRNRKEMIKAQIDTMSREDTAGYAMRLRMKGETEAAQQFEQNMQLVSNQLMGRFGKAGDSFKEMILQAVMSGRGLEATAEGANLAAMYGEAGGVLGDIIKQFESGKLDEKLFIKFATALESGTNNIDKNNFAVQKATNSSLGAVEAALLMRKTTTQVQRDAALRSQQGKAADKDAMTTGALILKGNELWVKSTAVLQSATSRIANAMVGDVDGKGALAPILEKSVDAVSGFLESMALFGKGNFKEGAKELANLVSDNTMAALLGTAVAVQTGRSVLGGNRTLAQRQDVASKVAAKNIEGVTSRSPDGKMSYGKKTYDIGSKFVHEGVEYKVGKNGVPEVTEKGIKDLTKRSGMSKAIKSGGAAGLMTAAFVAWNTLEEYQATGTQYDAIIKKAQEASGGKVGGKTAKEWKEEKNIQQQNIIGKGFAAGGGSVLGGMLGAGTGSVLGPIGTLLGSIVGSIGGGAVGEEVWNVIGKDIIQWMNENDVEEKEKETEGATYKLLEKISRLLVQLVSFNEIQTDTGLVIASATSSIDRETGHTNATFMQGT